MASTSPNPPRHRADTRSFLIRGVGPLVALIAVLALLGACISGMGRSGTATSTAGATGESAVAASASSPSSAQCDDGPSVRVRVAPELVAAVSSVATSLTTSGRCATYDVQGADPMTVLTQASDSATRSAVWIPDSSLWLAQAASALPQVPLTASGTVAYSPVVLGLTPQAAVGVPAGQVSWPALLGGKLPLKVSSADVSTATILGLVAATRQASKLGGDELAIRQSLGAGLTALAKSAASTPSPLPSGALPPVPMGFLASEAQLKAYDVAHPGSGLVARAPVDGTMMLDYPFVAVPGTTPEVSGAVTALREALTGEAGRSALAEAGFRATASSAGPRIGTEPAVAVSAMTPATSGETLTVLRQWKAFTSPLRLIVLVDTSGSMKRPIGPGVSRIEVAVGALAEGVSRLNTGTQASLWEFSTSSKKRGLHRVVIPPSTLTKSAAQRAQVKKQVLSVAGMVGGDTPLYATVLDAVAALRKDYDPKAIHAVIVLTDGKNEQPGGISLQQLTTSLKLGAGSGKDVYIGAIAVGTEADRASLRQMALATDGEYYLATTPADIVKVLTLSLMNFSG